MVRLGLTLGVSAWSILFYITCPVTRRTTCKNKLLIFFLRMCTKRPTKRLPQRPWRVSQVLHCRRYPTNGGRLFGTVPQRADVSWRHLQFQKWELCPDGVYCWGRPRIYWIYCWLLLLPGDVRVRIGAGLYHWRELPQVSFLSRQNTSFVATSILLSRQNT